MQGWSTESIAAEVLRFVPSRVVDFSIFSNLQSSPSSHSHFSIDSTQPPPPQIQPSSPSSPPSPSLPSSYLHPPFLHLLPRPPSPAPQQLPHHLPTHPCRPGSSHLLSPFQRAKNPLSHLKINLNPHPSPPQPPPLEPQLPQQPTTPPPHPLHPTHLTPTPSVA